MQTSINCKPLFALLRNTGGPHSVKPRVSDWVSSKLISYMLWTWLKSQMSRQEEHHANVSSPLQRVPVVVPASCNGWAWRRHPEADGGAPLWGDGWGQPADLGPESKRRLHWEETTTAPQQAFCWARYCAYVLRGSVCVFELSIWEGMCVSVQRRRFVWRVCMSCCGVVIKSHQWTGSVHLCKLKH